MAYINNQYIKLDKPLEEIADIEIKTDGNNKLIEDIEIDDYVNVMIAYGNKVKYNNIFGRVKILITDEKALIKNGYIIPEYIETIIIYGYIYGNNKREIERLKLGLKNGKKLISAIKEKKNKKILKLIENTEINVNVNINVDDGREMALNWACIFEMSDVAIKLIDRMSNCAINKWYEEGKTALYWACIHKMTDVAIKLIDRMSDEVINKTGEMALHWTYSHKMLEVSNKLINRMSNEAVN